MGCWIKLFIVFYVMVIIVSPLLLQYVIFPNNIYSPIDNTAWASFLGSYLGGIIGGVGTLLAVVISTKETRKIQKENELITRDIQRQNYMEAKTAQLNEHENTKMIQKRYQKIEERKVRIVFCNSLAKMLGEYIADISKYYYKSHSKKDF